MLSEGVYKVVYFDDEQPSAAFEPMLLILRSGAVTASDALGGVYFGEFESGANGLLRLTGSADIPPDGELVTGYVAGADGATVPLSIEISPESMQRRQTVTVGGRPVEVEISYLGPLPE